MPGDEYVPKEYWEKRLAERFTIEGVGHIAFGETYNEWAYKVRAAALRDLLAECRIDARGKTVLDIGVGTGYYLDLWKGLGAGDITGVDITSKSIGELQRRYPDERFLEADVTDPELELEGPFDIITAFDVLFHVVDEDRFHSALSNISRLAGDGGAILIMDFFLDRESGVGGHQKLRTREYYERALRENGMRLTEIRTVFTFMNPPFDVSRMRSSVARGLVRGTWWFNSNLARLCAKLGRAGEVVMLGWAPLLYHADRLASRRRGLGPSTKLALVRAEAGGAEGHAR